MTENEMTPTEGWCNIFKLIIPYFFIVGLFQWIAYYNLGLEINNIEMVHKTPFQLLIVSFATLLGTLITIWLMMKFADEKPFHTLGFKNHLIGKDICKGIFLGFIIMLLGFSILYFTNQIEVQNVVFDSKSFFFGLFLFIFVGIAEEVLVRGYILKNLLASFNNYIALFISAIIFSVLHLGNPFMDFISFTQLFVIGFLFGIPYVITRKLWFSIALHFSWNFFQGTVFGFNVSGNQHFSIIQTKFNTPTIWNGGYFGFEGSILCLLLQLMVISVILFEYRKKRKKSHIRNYKIFR
ncbi:COG1266 Predicted metal-dependent membrane protease [Flavobacteriaceae bacterium]